MVADELGDHISRLDLFFALGVVDFGHDRASLQPVVAERFDSVHGLPLAEFTLTATPLGLGDGAVKDAASQLEPELFVRVFSQFFSSCSTSSAVMPLSFMATLATRSSALALLMPSAITSA